MSFLKKILIYLIYCYQKTISPIMGPSCRFSPSCSFYMIDSLKEYGLLKGGALGFKRILKCHPWGSRGYDPVKKKDYDNLG